MSNSLEALFCHVDNFCKIFEPKWRQMLLGNGLQQRQRTRCLSMSEIMTILIGFHQNHYRNFKHFYEKQVCKYWWKEFPRLPSYNRFIEFMGAAMMPLCIYRGFQMSVYSFENKKSVPLRVLSFHFSYGKMKTAIPETLFWRMYRY
jgi:hypothetical protein